MTINEQLIALIEPHPGMSLFADANINHKNGYSCVKWRAIETTCKLEYSAEEDSYMKHITQRDAYGDTPEVAIAACLLAELTCTTGLI